MFTLISIVTTKCKIMLHIQSLETTFSIPIPKDKHCQCSDWLFPILSVLVPFSTSGTSSAKGKNVFPNTPPPSQHNVMQNPIKETE